MSKKQAFVNLPLSQLYDGKMSDEDIKAAFILLIEEQPGFIISGLMYDIFLLEPKDITVTIVDLKVE